MIACGSDFDDAIRDALRSCAVCIPVVDRRWIDATDERGRPRLELPDDYVRQEIAYALNHDIAVMPVLVDGAPIPTARQLPDEFAALARRQMFELREARWDDGVSALMRQIEQTADLTADCPELASRSPLRDAPGHFLRDLLQLHANPVRFLSRLNTGQLHELFRAMMFFAIAVIAGDVVLFGSGRWARFSWAELATGVLSGVPIWLTVAMVLAFVLWLA